MFVLGEVSKMANTIFGGLHSVTHFWVLCKFRKAWNLLFSFHPNHGNKGCVFKLLVLWIHLVTKWRRATDCPGVHTSLRAICLILLFHLWCHDTPWFHGSKGIRKPLVWWMTAGHLCRESWLRQLLIVSLHIGPSPLLWPWAIQTLGRVLIIISFLLHGFIPRETHGWIPNLKFVHGGIPASHLSVGRESVIACRPAVGFSLMQDPWSVVPFVWQLNKPLSNG